MPIKSSTVSPTVTNGNGPHYRNGASTAAATEEPVPVPLAEIETAIRGVRFGAVQVIIENGVVIQINRTEKLRLGTGR